NTVVNNSVCLFIGCSYVITSPYVNNNEFINIQLTAFLYRLSQSSHLQQQAPEPILWMRYCYTRSHSILLATQTQNEFFSIYLQTKQNFFWITYNAMGHVI